MNFWEALGLILIILYSSSVLYKSRSRRQISVPAVGYEGFLGSYWSAYRFLHHAQDILQAGYIKIKKNGVFKIPLMDKWMVIIAGDRLYEDLRNAPDNALSMWDANIELLQVDFTLGRQLRENPYHDSIIRNTLTRNLDALLPDVLDETICALGDLIPQSKALEWIPVSLYSTLAVIVCRVVNRPFVGLPICRNEDYCDLNINFTGSVIVGATLINIFPRFLQPLVGNLYYKVARHNAKMLKHLGQEIENRKQDRLEHGSDYEGKPNDLLTWLLDTAPPGLEQEPKSIALRVLITNFMTHHSTCSALTHAVFHLAAEPTYVAHLRDEIKAVLGSDDHSRWTVKNFDECHKLDSFLKETLRLHGIGALSLPRKSLVPYRFSDGTVIPPGVIVTACTTNVHLDEEKYERAHTFDGFRFEKMRKTSSDSNTSEVKYKLTSGGSDFLSFGGGRHMCPGRFFGSLLLKCMLAHLVLHYDVKLETEGQRPKDEWFGPVIMPARHAKVLFRRKEVSI